MSEQRPILDAAFLEQLKERRPDAFDLLVREFETALYRFHYCAHGDHHAAQDQTSETFVELVRSLPSMRGGVSQLRAFVYSIARRVQQRHWNSRRATVALDSDAAITDRRPPPDTVLADQEQVNLLLDAIRGLDVPVRNVLLLRFVEEYSLDEVAAALDMPLGTVKSHIHRGRVQLARILSGKGCQT
jgi:RNA polymerase sigma-70 factor, ECF subfamily